MQRMTEAKAAAFLLLALIPVGIGLGAFTHWHFFVETSDWFANFILPLFFFVVGAELRAEFTSGYFRVKRNLVAPSVAAALGVATPALLYASVAGTKGGGWSVPTATDITLGLAVLTFARPAISAVLRPRFLALATIDDVLALVILGLVFSKAIQLLPLALMATALIAVFAAQRALGGLRYLAIPLGMMAVYIGWIAGIQTSLVGVALGMIFVPRGNLLVIERANSWVVLPIFTLLVSASSGIGLSAGVYLPVLLAVLWRPFGKFLGISIGGAISAKLTSGKADFRSWSLIGLLGGIGFTVSLLLASLAFAGDPSGYVAAVIGTISAAVFCALAFLVITRVITRRGRRDEKSL